MTATTSNHLPVTALARMPMPAMLAELRTLYTDTPSSLVMRLLRHIEDLEAQLAAVGAGGVEPLRKRQDHVEDDLDMVAADAARYRWLRDPSRPDDSDEEGNFIPGVISGLFICVDESLSEWISGDELDAAIDAAIQAKRAAAGQTDRKEAA